MLQMSKLRLKEFCFVFFTAVRYGACNERQNLKPVFAQLKVWLFSLEYNYFFWRFPNGPPVSTFAGCGPSQAEHSESLRPE